MKKNRYFNIKNLEEILANMPGNIVWKNIDGTYEGCNNNAARLLKLNHPSDIKGKTSFELLPKDKVDKVVEADNYVMQHNQSIIFEELGHNIDGDDAIYLSEKKPIYDDNGKVIGLLAIAIDITDKKRNEMLQLNLIQLQLAEANARAQAEAEIRQSVAIFSGSIAHDLRTPIATMATLNGSLETYLPIFIEGYEKAREANIPLTNEHIPHPREVALLKKIPKEIQAQLEDMSTYIKDNLRSLSAVLTDQLTEADMTICHSSRCLRQTILRYPFTPLQKTLVHHDDQYYFEFKANELLMFRVLSNLIKNALEQIEINGHGTIHIWAEDSGNTHRIHIKDTAGGAPPDIMTTLFSGFKTTKKDGTGIGLAFCKKTLNQFGADIEAISIYGESMDLILSFPKIS